MLHTTACQFFCDVSRIKAMTAGEDSGSLVFLYTNHMFILIELSLSSAPLLFAWNNTLATFSRHLPYFLFSQRPKNIILPLVAIRDSRLTSHVHGLCNATGESFFWTKLMHQSIPAVNTPRATPVDSHPSPGLFPKKFCPGSRELDQVKFFPKLIKRGCPVSPRIAHYLFNFFV